MQDQLKDKVALVTGGSRGIGYAIAEAYLKAGAKVVICARNEGVLHHASERLAHYGEVLSIPCDISKLDAVQAMVDRAMGHFGRIDCLVNNAAISMTYGRAGDVDPGSWAEVIAVNLTGTFNCSHAILPHMLKQRKGCIINLKGYGAGFPSPRLTAYGASKAGISAFTRSLAREYRGTGIRVNLLSPGLVKTDLLMNRETTKEGTVYLDRFKPIIDRMAGDASHAAKLSVKIASNECASMTGKEFRVLSKTKMLFRLTQIGLQLFLCRIQGKSG